VTVSKIPATGNCEFHILFPRIYFIASQSPYQQVNSLYWSSVTPVLHQWKRTEVLSFWIARAGNGYAAPPKYSYGEPW